MECRKYVNEKYAINGRCVGSDPLSPDDVIENNNTLQLEFDYKGNNDSGCKIEDINYKKDLEAMTKATNQKSEGIGNLEKEYWLASRDTYSYSDGASVAIFKVNSNGILDSFTVWAGYSNDSVITNRNSYGLRPVINLYLNVLTNYGDGSENNPFKLVEK